MTAAVTLSPAHDLILNWLLAHPGQSAADMADALSFPGDVEEITQLCHDLEARGLIASASSWRRAPSASRPRRRQVDQSERVLAFRRPSRPA